MLWLGWMAEFSQGKNVTQIYALVGLDGGIQLGEKYNTNTSDWPPDFRKSFY
jgi:hypothetical protein